MPVQYKGIRDEHMAVRNNAGIFDVSHMGEILITGGRALEVVQELTVNDASRLMPGKAQYSVMCRYHGGVVDDLLVYCLSPEEYLLVINASNIEKDYNWIIEINGGRAEISNISDEIALIALQGPKAAEILETVTNGKPSDIPLFEFRSLKVSDYDNILVSSTGYTGEKGFELYCNIRHVNVCDLWESIMLAGDAHGLMPCGLGARDSLRLEAGLALYGNDLTEEYSPLEASLGWMIAWDKESFVGKDALVEQKNTGVKRKLHGFVMKEEKRIPRSGQAIVTDTGEVAGEVTSGGYSFVRNRGIAMGYITTDFIKEDKPVYITVRNKNLPAEIVKPPFYKRKK